jgi:hypothetical protein
MGLLKLWEASYDRLHQTRIGDTMQASPNGSFQEMFRVFHGIECEWNNFDNDDDNFKKNFL